MEIGDRIRCIKEGDYNRDKDGLIPLHKEFIASTKIEENKTIFWIWSDGDSETTVSQTWIDNYFNEYYEIVPKDPFPVGSIVRLLNNPGTLYREDKYSLAQKGDTFKVLGSNETEIFYREYGGAINWVEKDHISLDSAPPM